MKIIHFDRTICQNLDQAVRREWLETNGFGAYASSTLAGVNTRRYHGLLVVPVTDLFDRYVTLNDVAETVFVGDTAFELSTHFYADTVYPKGYQHLEEFSLYPYPTWIFKCEDLVMMKSVFLVYGEPKVIIRYRILSGDENWVRMELRPLISGRKSDNLTQVSEKRHCQIEASQNMIRCLLARTVPELYFAHNASIVDRHELWLKGVRYPEETKRGLDFEEDLCSPFRLEYNFLRSGEVFLSASTQAPGSEDPTRAAMEEEIRRQNLVKNTYSEDSCFHLLSFSGASFFINRPHHETSSQDGESLVSGYPWYDEKSREALLAFHGLVLSTRAGERARKLLVRWSELFEDGFIPDCLCGAKGCEKHYAADTPLLFIHDCFEYFQYTKDRTTVQRSLFPVMRSIIEWYIKGSRNGIRLTAEGLISCNLKQTWMNVHRGNLPMTKVVLPVEIEALWYNALIEMAEVGEQLSHSTLAKTYRQLASRARQQFNQLFWFHHPKLNADYLCDYISGNDKETVLRPNQLLALCLPYPIIDGNAAKIKSMIESVRKHLVTPYGLRTLASWEAGYGGRCEGTEAERERIYYNGTVWPWLLPFYVKSCFLAYPGSKKVKVGLIEFLRPLSERLTEKGLGFISEVFDGDFPHEPRGMIASSANAGACLHLHEILLGKSISIEKSGQRTQV